ARRFAAALPRCRRPAPGRPGEGERMHVRLKCGIGLALLALAATAWADEPAWRPTKCSTMNEQPGGAIPLGRPQALPAADAIAAPPSLVQQVRLEAPTPMARAQTGEVPPVPQQPVFPTP